MGRAAALALARAGAAVFLVGRRVEPLDAVRREIEALGGTATLYSADVSRREEVKAAVAHMWPLHEHDVIAGAPAMVQKHEITGRLVAPL